MPTTRAGAKAGATRAKERGRGKSKDFSTNHSPITPTKKDNKKKATQASATPVAISSTRGATNKRMQSTLDTWAITSSTLLDPAVSTLPHSVQYEVSAAFITVDQERAQSDIISSVKIRSAADIPSEDSPNKKRRVRQPSPALSNSSLSDLRVLLSASPEVQKRIDELAERKFNHKSNKKTTPDHATQTERLLSREDTESLLRIKDEAKRQRRENKLIKQQLAAEKMKVMWMAGEISKWKELVRQMRYGDDSDRDSWSSRQGALEKLCGDIEGWKAGQGDDSD